MPLTNRYRDLDQCIQDYEEWYLENELRTPTLESGVRFLKLAVDGRLFIIHMLLEEIMSLRKTYTNVTDVDRALDSFTTWYAANSDTITDVLPLLQFLKKSTDDTLMILHLLRDELRDAEGKQAQDSVLWLPLSYR